MQEQQGNLEEPLSRLPGPRPFKKGNKMEDNNNKELNDIVARATEHLTSGKAFGGWTDKVEDHRVKQGKPIKVKLGKGKKIGVRSADIGPGGKEHNVKTDAEWDKQKKDKSGTMSGLQTPEEKGTKVGVLSHVEHDGASLDEKVATQPRQLKDKKTEVLVHDKKGKVTTIDRKDLDQYQKDNPGSGVAEGVGQIGSAIREGAKGAAAGAALGSILPGIGTIAGGLVGYALGDAGAAVTGVGKKKKSWDDK